MTPNSLIASSRRRWRTSLRLRAALVTLACAVLTAAQTWPHIARLNSTILGGGADAPEGIRLLWALARQGGTTFTSSRDYLLGAPEGTPVLRAAAAAAPIFNGVLWVLGNLFGWIVAMNGYGLLVFILSATCAYLLFDAVVGAGVAALFGTFVFTFNPNHVEKLYGTAPLAATGIIPLALLALLRGRERRTAGRAIVAGMAVVGAFYLDPYLGLLTVWLFGVFAVVDASTRTGPWYPILRYYYFTALTLSVGLIPAAIAMAANASSVNQFTSGRAAPLHGGSASLATYLLPGPRNPWIGGPMRTWLSHHLSWEPTMFIGYTTMALAVAGVAIAYRRHRRNELQRAEAFLVIFAIALTVTAAFASLPPTVSVAGVSIPTPQFFLRHVATVYRVYSRFGVLVGFGLALLAAYSLSRIALVRRRVPWTAWVPAAALVLAAFELYVPRPRVVRLESIQIAVTTRQIGAYESGRPVIEDTSHPPAYVNWLRRNARGLEADYPDPAEPDGRWSWRDQFDQIHHHLPLWEMANGQVDDSGIRAQAADLADPLTSSILAAEGVRWVVVHTERYRARGEAPPRPACGLRKQAAFPNGVVVYKTNAAARNGLWAAPSGLLWVYNPKLWPESLGMRWMQRSVALRVYSGRYGSATLSLVAVSLNHPRTLTLSEGDTTIGSAAVNTTGSVIRFPLSVAAGFHDYTLRAEGPLAVRGQGDTRLVSLAIGSLRVSPGAGWHLFSCASPS